jgi:hypothetical protein
MAGLLTPENLMGAPMFGKRGAAYKRFLKLEDDRSSWRSQWIELSDYLLPRRGRYLLESQSTKGRKRNTKIIDNTAGQALRVMAAGMMSGLTSPARPWFRLQPEQEDVMEAEGVKLYLGQCEAIIRKILSASNFYNAASTCYFELGSFGTHPMMRRQHPQRLVNYRNFTAGEYVIAENEYGQVDTLGREFTMTVSQVVEQFLWDPVGERIRWELASKSLKSLWERKNYDELVEIIHMIQPRRNEERDLTRMDGMNRPFADMYFEKGADNDVLLREDGYNRFPVFCPRWDVLGGDVYGYSPGMEHLGDIKQLQHEQRRKAQAIDKMVNPPMRASNSLKGKTTTTLPGGVTYVDPMHGNDGFAPLYQVQPRINEMMMDIQEVQERIQRGFYADLFAMMINSDRRQMTATEVAERHEEKLVLLGPILQRLSTEFLDPLIEDIFILANEAGLLPDPPEALQGADVSIKYVSLLAQAQEAAAASSLERTLSFSGNLAGVFPEILDNIDEDVAFREYAEILGTSPGVIRDMSAVRQRREDRRAREEQEREMAMAEQAASTGQSAAQGAELLSRTDTQNPNALTALLQRGQSIV